MDLQVARVRANEQLVMDGASHFHGISAIFVFFDEKASECDGMVADSDVIYSELRMQNAGSRQFRPLPVKCILDGGGSGFMHTDV